MLKEKHREAGVSVYQKVPPCSSGLGALIQGSQIPFQTDPANKLGPAPQTRANAWILSAEAQVIGMHQDRRAKCACLLPDC